MKQIDASRVIAALRKGPPEKIGYGEQTSKAFDAGWSAAMNAVWEQLRLAPIAEAMERAERDAA